MSSSSNRSWAASPASGSGSADRYSRGHRFRMARSTAGRCLITGPTSGLGRAAAQALAALGARLILVGRSKERLGVVRDALVRTHGVDRFPIVVADMGSLVSVRAAVTTILETESRLDVLIDNAGAIFAERIDGPGWHRGHLRDPGRRPVRACLGPAPAPPADAGFAGHRGHFGRDVLPAARSG
jgi:NAD(P)-dependent dehydrogenase (short-subunit alcohol dehydrogenase family)